MAALRVHYSDRNGYPFTALSSVPVLTSAIAPDDEPVRASAPDIILKHNEGEIQVRLEATETLDAPVEVRALSCCHFSLLSGGDHKISFDEITVVMKETGQALPSLYRETAGGGIAQAYRQRKQD